MILDGIMAVVEAVYLIVRNALTLEGAVLCVFGMAAAVAGYGLLKLKRWTLPLFVALNVAGVLEHFILNIPFTFGNVVPLLILFYLVKRHALFDERRIPT